jgi:hypothetical protein
MTDNEVYSYDTSLFYKTLQTRYRKYFEIIQEQNGLVCIPLRNINEERLQITNFVLKHLYTPSPFIKNLYNSINNQEFDVLFIESNSYNLFVLDKINKITSIAKVLGEEIGYAFDQKSYRILIIEYPLFEHKENSSDSNDQIQSIKKNQIQENDSFEAVSNVKKSSEYLQKISSSINENFKHEIKIFKETYVILVNYVESCEEELLKIHEKYFNKFLDFHDYSASQEILSIAIENVLNFSLYDKIWPIIKSLNYEKDEILNFKLNQLFNHIDNDTFLSNYLKIHKKYLIDYNLSISEIKKIHLLKTVYEKLICMKTFIDLISTELTLYYKSNDSYNNLKENELQLTSDQLLPLTCYVIIKSKLSLLYSLVYFTEKFNLTSIYASSNSIYLSTTNELSFIFSTFKAAVGLIETFV